MMGAGRVRLAGLVKNLYVAIFWDTVNVVNVKLCLMVVLIYRLSFTPLLVTLTLFLRLLVVNSFNESVFVVVSTYLIKKFNFVCLLNTWTSSCMYTLLMLVFTLECIQGR